MVEVEVEVEGVEEGEAEDLMCTGKSFCFAVLPSIPFPPSVTASLSLFVAVISPSTFVFLFGLLKWFQAEIS